MKARRGGKRAETTAYPVVFLGAEHLAMGHLMRRNILTCKAARGSEGYDLLCSRPDSPRRGRRVRVQLKSRLGPDGGGALPIAPGTLDAFDYLILVHLNVGRPVEGAAGPVDRGGSRPPEFYTFPASFIRERVSGEGSRARLEIGGLDLARCKDEAGFEQIATDLDVPYPRTAR